MYRCWLLAAVGLALMTGGAFAQTSSSSTTTTQSTTAAPVPALGGTSWSSSRQTTDRNGVMTEKSETSTTGTTISPTGETVTTRKTTESTTVR